MLFNFQEMKLKVEDCITLNQLVAKAEAFGRERGRDFNNAPITIIKEGVEHHLSAGDIIFKATRTKDGIVLSVVINPIDKDTLYPDED